MATPEHYPGQRAQALACELATTVPFDPRWRTVMTLVELGGGSLTTASQVAVRMLAQAPEAQRTAATNALDAALRELLRRPSRVIVGTEDPRLAAAVALVDLHGAWVTDPSLGVEIALQWVTDPLRAERALRVASAVGASSPTADIAIREALERLLAQRERFTSYGDAADDDARTCALLRAWLSEPRSPVP